MPKARYLAPWRQVDLVRALEDGELDEEALAALRGKPAIYHCISRVVDRRFVFGTREKEKFVGLMRVYERFCQVRVLAFCVMSNHFHILLEVPAPPDGRGRDWSDEKFLRHLSCLYSQGEMAEIRWQLEHFREQGADSAAERFRDSYFRRMWDLSQFMKPLKQCFTRWFNREQDRRGTLWEERFKSVLVEDGHAARVMAAYIDLNPVRAGMVEHPKDYRWSSYGEAVGGQQRAREGIQRVMFESGSAWGGSEEALKMLSNWEAAVSHYQKVLFAYLQKTTAQEGEGLREDVGPCGAEALGGRIRSFIDGLVVGSRPFIDHAFRLTRERFGPRRRDGARKIRGMPGALCAMRDLQEDPNG